MQMAYTTRGNLPPKGKKYLFVHAAKSNFGLRDQLAKRILAFSDGLNYSIWHTDEPEAVFSELEGPTLGSMLVFIALVTPEYLALCRSHGAGRGSGTPSFLEALQLRGIAILPIFENVDTISEFTRLFGDIHGIFLTNPDADRLIEAQLSTFLPDDELASTITREAFTSTLFLSYRKKDIAEALEVMKAIHNTSVAQCAAIWFDEFLVAGRDFNDEILESLRACDAMALAVTPNLLEAGNYVMDKEYPSATELGKDVIPIEAHATKPADLSAAYPGIGACANVNDTHAIEGLLKKAGFQGPESISPFATYLLGMAFLFGISVEKDEARAVQLLTSSAKQNCVEACEELGFLYTAGLAVKRDHDRSIDYKLQAYDLLMAEEPSKERTEQLYELLYGRDGLCLLLKSKGRGTRNRQISRAFIAYLDMVDDGDEAFTLYRANANSEIADLHFDGDYDPDLGTTGLDAGSERLLEAQTAAMRATNLLNAYHGDDKDEADFLKATAYALLSDVCRRSESVGEAVKYGSKAKRCIADLERRTGHLDHKEQARNISMYLGDLLMQVSVDELLRNPNPLRSIELALPAIREWTDTIKRARELMEIHPSISNREGMALALYNYSRITSDGKVKKMCRAEAYHELRKLQQETGDGSFDDEIEVVGKATRWLDRRRIDAGKDIPSIEMERLEKLLEESEYYAGFTSRR
ncbi:MAG: toll/interleukin-1 receptor domain-containing protein [Atopobiaceae bacterium]|nr:toll/interleukin-1 receptor domain-containing protein [Atopobiaceae bacterium]